MIKEIIKDEGILCIPSSPASIEDMQTAVDLLDTLKANSEACVGMAANMIGISKCIITINEKEDFFVMFNPQIVKRSNPYNTEEGCLSLSGTRKVKRFSNIKVQYQNVDFKVRIKSFNGFTAQIIQHEIDHCNGILI